VAFFDVVEGMEVQAGGGGDGAARDAALESEQLGRVRRAPCEWRSHVVGWGCHGVKIGGVRRCVKTPLCANQGHMTSYGVDVVTLWV
jgi:hypothetical protein